MTREEILSKAKPILFSTEMVKAILDGRKTVTRRIVKNNPEECKSKVINGVCKICDDKGGFYLPNDYVKARSPYQVGDYLYVRETFYKDPVRYLYKANYSDNGIFYRGGIEISMKWCPSIHMPKEATRIFLRVTDIRVERLQDITAEDCISEGIDTDSIELPPICRQNIPTEEQQRKYDNMTAEQQEQYINELAKHTYMGWCVYGARLRTAFGKLWNSTIKKSDLDKYGWNANPWVWVIEFERVEVE